MGEYCHDCEYAQMERAGIHMTHAGMDQAKADALAAGERCAAHTSTSPWHSPAEGRPPASGEGAELKIIVIQHERLAKQEGEYVGWPRTLAGPFRMGFDGTRDEVLRKYKVWLFGEVKAKGQAFRKLGELMPQARRAEGLTLVCLEPAIGEIIASCLRWMAGKGNEGIQ